MRTDAFDYELPESLVAQEPASRRDASRLMVLRRSGAGIEEMAFARLAEHVSPGDLVVLNDTRVVPARLLARKRSGGEVEILLLARAASDPGGREWDCMVSTGRGMRPGARLSIGAGFEAEVLGETERGRIRIRLHAERSGVEEAIERHGMMPVPPYIRRAPGDARARLDRERYQTVFAREPGAVAAPTAGLHFTDEVLRSLEARGASLAFLTLHVGPGTFKPVRAERIEDHELEPEDYRLPEATARAIATCRARGGRVIAVGTTVTRVLEACADGRGAVVPGDGRCALYITPGHRFRIVDALLTNLHLPRSSLLVLVAAFAGRERILAAYGEAVARGFRFYSYGDAMLIV